MVKAKYRALLVGGGEKLHGLISELLPKRDYDALGYAADAGEARRKLLSASADIVIINTPLTDDFGIELALDLVQAPIGVLLLVKSELYEQTCYRVEDNGVLTLSKPVTRQSLFEGVKLLTALAARLQKMDQKNQSLQEKMADIRTVNRAKWLLIEHLSMTEKDAHYYIEKQAMDTRLSRREIAENIIRTYDN